MWTQQPLSHSELLSWFKWQTALTGKIFREVTVLSRLLVELWPTTEEDAHTGTKEQIF